MSDRRSRSKAKTKTLAWTAAGIVHLVIIGAMVFNFTSEPEVIQAFDADEIADTVKATVIDESEIKNRQDELKKQDQDKKRKEELEKKRLKDLQQQAEKEKAEIAELQDQKQRDLDAAADAEEKRKKVKLKAEQEELERLKKEEERKKKEAAERKRRQLAAAKKKKADEKERVKRQQQEAEAQQRLDMLLEEETRMLQEQEQAKQQQAAQQLSSKRTTTVLNRYVSLIRDAINSKRTIAPDFERWRVARFNIKLSSRGDVISVRIVDSSGSERYDRDAETAIRQASPLPIPTETEDAGAHRTLTSGINLRISMPGAN